VPPEILKHGWTMILVSLKNNIGKEAIFPWFDVLEALATNMTFPRFYNSVTMQPRYIKRFHSLAYI
jgi:hypothetical protein